MRGLVLFLFLLVALVADTAIFLVEGPSASFYIVIVFVVATLAMNEIAVRSYRDPSIV